MDIQHRRLIRYIYGEAKKEGEEYKLGTEIQGDPPMITGAAAQPSGWTSRNVALLYAAPTLL